MKKNILKAVIAVVFIVGAMMVNFQENSQANSFDIIISGKQAKAIVSQDYHICYSQSKVKVGYTYYDCGACTDKVYDEKGKGTYSKCFL